MTDKLFDCLLSQNRSALWLRTVSDYLKQRFEWKPTHDASLRVMWHLKYPEICHYQWTLCVNMGHPCLMPNFTNWNVNAEYGHCRWQFFYHTLCTLASFSALLFTNYKLVHNVHFTCPWVGLCSTLCPNSWGELLSEIQILPGLRKLFDCYRKNWHLYFLFAAEPPVVLSSSFNVMYIDQA